MLALLNDTKVLSHTRGVSIINLMRLLSLIKAKGPKGVSQTILADNAKRAGIEGFENYGFTSTLPTRVRHYWYALEQLKWVNKEPGIGKGANLYTLTENAREVLAHITPFSLGRMEDLPRSSLLLLRNKVRESAYVQSIWLSFTELHTGQDKKSSSFILEKVSSSHYCDQLVDLAIFEKGTWKDSGYRIYPTKGINGWQSKCIFTPQHIRGDIRGLILSETARKEIVTGVRHWCTKELGITSETPAEVPEHLQECIDSRVEVWNVERLLPDDEFDINSIVIGIQGIIKEQGQGPRMSMPDLIAAISKMYRISVSNTKQLLSLLHKDFAYKFYFESASEGILPLLKVPNHLEYYVLLGGIWRSGIRLL